MKENWLERETSDYVLLILLISHLQISMDNWSLCQNKAEM